MAAFVTPAVGAGAAATGPTVAQRAAGATPHVVLSVTVHSMSASARVRRVAASLGARSRHTFPALHVMTLSVPADRVAVVEHQLRLRGDVSSVEQLAPRRLSAAPSDPLYGRQVGYLTAVNAPAAWDTAPGSPSVSIAVVDTGVDVHHPDLAGKVTGAFNATNGGADVTDEVGHGTFVAGVAAASTDNAIGVAGAGNASSVLAVKVANAGVVDVDDEAAGVMWAADRGARVINLSMGGPRPSTVEQNAIAYAQSKGALVVAAAGNDGDQGNPVEYPAAYPNVVAVGGTDAAGRRASFSSFGSWVTVAAPATGIYSTAPTAGSALFSAGYDSADGTSFAAPLVAGEAALLAAYEPAASAATIRRAIVAGARGYAGLGLGAGQVDFSAALAALPPASTPTLSGPAPDAQVTGHVTVAAASRAGAVQLYVDDHRVGAPVQVTGGTAAIDWETWGLSNGAHHLAAADCNDYGCGVAGAAIAVTVTNPAPQLTAPGDGVTVTGTVSMTATATGGGVAFYVDGTRRGFAATAPYAAVVDVGTLPDGPHQVSAVSCSASGAACAGPTSSAVTITSRSLHPSVTAVSPAVISPNGDRKLDVATVSFSLPDEESVVLRVVDSAGATIAGRGLGEQPAGPHSVVWDGRAASGRPAADGTYSLVLTTSRTVAGDTVDGTASSSVRVDDTPPTLSGLTGASATFYPVADGYADTWAPAVTLGEPATMTLHITTSPGTRVRDITTTFGKPGRYAIRWNGRTNAGAPVAAGTYRWHYTSTDVAANVRSTSTSLVYVSAKRLVARTAYLTRNGRDYVAGGSTDESCANTSLSASDFTTGVWLVNQCAPTSAVQIAVVLYRATLPAAVRYNRLTLQVYGFGIAPPTRVIGSFENYSYGEPDLLSGFAITDYSLKWRTLGAVSPASHYDAARQVEFGVVVPNLDGRDDFDIGQVRVAVNYSVLQ